MLYRIPETTFFRNATYNAHGMDIPDLIGMR